MKSILISIRPEFVAKILNGEKTIEIRKTAPKCDLPIDVYIYCTKGDYIGRISNKYVGKVVAKFTLCEIENIGKYAYSFKDRRFYELLGRACLTPEDLAEYAKITRYEFEKNGMGLYAWHISDLQIFDKPKDLSEFGLAKAPQSWQYVEAKE